MVRGRMRDGSIVTTVAVDVGIEIIAAAERAALFEEDVEGPRLPAGGDVDGLVRAGRLGPLGAAASPDVPLARGEVEGVPAVGVGDRFLPLARVAVGQRA